MSNKISNSLARVGVAVALILGVILSAVQIFLDYQDQLKQNDALVENALHIASAGATQAAYELSADEAGTALQTLMVHPYFTLGEIVSESGETLNSIAREPKVSEPWSAGIWKHNKVYELDLRHQQGNLEVGKLRVSVHTATIMQDFFNRSVRLLVAGILRSLILTAILLYVFNTMLTRPISEFIENLKNINPRAPKAAKVPARIAKANDELTDLAESTNAILEANQEFLVEIDKQRVAASEFAEKLHHSERLSIVGKLTGGVAHDFNNILAIILGNFELLGSDKNLKDDSKQLVDTGIKATMHGAMLTKQLLAYSRRQPLDPKKIDVKDFFIDLESLVTGALGNRFQIKFIISDELWHCFADVRQLESVVLNLAINSRDAMSNGDTLTIEAYNERYSQENHSPYTDDIPNGDYVCITVTDNGIGMSSEVLANAFEPYYTTKEVGEGSGLGLSTVYGFVKQSGGHIRIDSKEGEGTSVKICLPRFDKPYLQDSTEASVSAISANVQIGRTLLVVEDNKPLCEVLVSYLSQMKVKAITATDTNTALKKAEQVAHFDGALIDVMLPGPMNGPELAGKLLDLHPELPVAFMSGYIDDPVFRDVQHDDGTFLLHKPFQFDDLQEVVDGLLSHKDSAAPELTNC